MSTLYIANLTNQPHEFHYRVPADDGGSLTRRIQVQRIAPGNQQQIHMEAPLAVLEAIVDQHRKYGLKPIDEVARIKDYIGLAFQFDKPIKFDPMNYAVDHNRTVLEEMGNERREETALAVAEALDQNSIEAQRAGAPLPVPRAVSIEELEDSENPTFGKGVRVDRAPQPSATTAARPSRRRARKGA